MKNKREIEGLAYDLHTITVDDNDTFGHPGLDAVNQRVIDHVEWGGWYGAILNKADATPTGRFITRVKKTPLRYECGDIEVGQIIDFCLRVDWSNGRKLYSYVGVVLTVDETTGSFTFATVKDQHTSRILGVKLYEQILKPSIEIASELTGDKQ